ncbi:hypothetical protein [Brevundimonas sp.]|jgi:hypothetical protein|uniref:hypothetical protein n=1 Tax=Brevundimonas sp. TaxID=1871086 RepID=UPI002E0D67DD|nr:hypothetical protein [Brevundimonas sp.]
MNMRVPKLWVALTLGPLLVVIGRLGWETYDRHRDERAVQTAVLAQFGDQSGARVIDVDSDRSGVCGWVAPSRGRSALAFYSLRPPPGHEALPLVPERDVGGAVERARAARVGNLVRYFCGSTLPPAPPGAFEDPATDQAVDQLDRLGVEWVAIRPSGVEEYVVLGRNGSGGKVTFDTREDAEAWISQQNLLDVEKRESFRQCYAMPPSVAQDACLRKARATAPRSATS